MKNTVLNAIVVSLALAGGIPSHSFAQTSSAQKYSPCMKEAIRQMYTYIKTKESTYKTDYEIRQSGNMTLDQSNDKISQFFDWGTESMLNRDDGAAGAGQIECAYNGNFNGTCTIGICTDVPL